MAKQKEAETQGKLRWYRVKEESFIGDAIRQEGDYVQFRGEPGSNLEAVTEDEVRKSGQRIEPSDKDKLENLEADLNEREREIADREAKLEIRQQEVEDLEKAINEKSEALNKREADLAEREAKLAK